MTALVVIVLYVIALLVVLILVGGVRRGDELHERAMRSMRKPTRGPAEAIRPEHYASPWSTVPEEPGQASSDSRGRSAVHS